MEAKRSPVVTICGARFLTGPCVREPGHEPPHRDASGCEWRGVSAVDL